MAIITLYTEKPKKQPGKKKPKAPPPSLNTYSDEERINAVKLVLFEGYSALEAGKRCGCSESSVRKWTAAFRDRVLAENPERELYRDVMPARYPTARRYSEREQIRAVEMVLYEGYTQIEAGERFGCTTSTISRWMLELKNKVIAINPDRPLTYTENFRKDDEEGRLRAVEMVLYEGVSITEAAERMKCGKTTIWTWLRLYSDRVKAMNPGRPLNDARPPHKTFTDEDRKKIVEEFLYSGKSYIDLEKEYGCSNSSIYSWLKQFREEVVAENPGRPLYNRSLLRGTPLEERLKAVEMLLYSGMSSHQVAKQFGHDSWTILGWEKECRDQVIARNPGRPIVYQRAETDPYPVRDRINAAKLVIFGGKKFEEVAERFGYRQATVRKWVQRYYDKLTAVNPDLEVKFSFGTPQNKLSESEKLRIVERALFEGASRTDLSEEYGVARNSVNQWVKLYADRVQAENPDRVPVSRSARWKGGRPRKKAVVNEAVKPEPKKEIKPAVKKKVGKKGVKSAVKKGKQRERKELGRPRGEERSTGALGWYFGEP